MHYIVQTARVWINIKCRPGILGDNPSKINDVKRVTQFNETAVGFPGKGDFLAASEFIGKKLLRKR